MSSRSLTRDAILSETRKCSSTDSRFCNVQHIMFEDSLWAHMLAPRAIASAVTRCYSYMVDHYGLRSEDRVDLTVHGKDK